MFPHNSKRQRACRQQMKLWNDKISVSCNWKKKNNNNNKIKLSNQSS